MVSSIDLSSLQFIYSLCASLPFSFLESLIETVFYPNRVSASDPVSSILPSLSASLLTQQFLPLLPFPTYFESLYEFLSELQKKTNDLNGSTSGKALESEDPSSSPGSVKDHGSGSNAIITFLCERFDTLLDVLDQDGLKLLLVYLIPFFQHQSTRFQAAFVLTDPLVMHLARRHVQQVLTPSFIRMFDLFGDPASRCGMLSQWMAEKVIHWFGLGVFLTRFLPCILESVIEPLVRAILSKKPTTLPQSRGSSFLAASEDFSSSDRSSQRRLTSSMTAAHGYSAPVSLGYTNWDRRGYGGGSDSESDDSDTEMAYSQDSLMATKMPSMIAYLSETDQRLPSSLSELDSQGDNAGARKTGDATWETLQPSQHLSLPPSQSLADSFSSSTSSGSQQQCLFLNTIELISRLAWNYLLLLLHLLLLSLPPKSRFMSQTCSDYKSNRRFRSAGGSRLLRETEQSKSERACCLVSHCCGY